MVICKLFVAISEQGIERLKCRTTLVQVLQSHTSFRNRSLAHRLSSVALATSEQIYIVNFVAQKEEKGIAIEGPLDKISLAAAVAELPGPTGSYFTP